MDKKQFIDQLHRDSSIFSNEKQAKGYAAVLNTISSDIYSESQRFVFELIQNADDSREGSNNKVHFEFLPGAVIISHHGKVFSADDVNSITDAGASTKKADPNKTGYKGIGFKSVFGRSNRVSIFSDGYQFRFDKSFHTKTLPWQIIPIWSEFSDYNPAISNHLLLYDYPVSTVIELDESFELAKELKEIISNGQILLFLRGINEISISINGKKDFTISKRSIKTESAFEQIALLCDQVTKSEWLFKRFDNIIVPQHTKDALEQDKNAPEKLLEMNVTELCFAARLMDGKITSVPQQDNVLYTYLPTKVKEFAFPMLVNAGFMTSAAREALSENSPWNQWLFEIMGEKMISWISALAYSDFKLQLLNILPSAFSDQTNGLRGKFNKSFLEAIKNYAFIPCKLGTVRKIAEVIVDQTGLSNQDFLKEASIINFINQELKTSLPTDCFIHPELERSNKLSDFGVKSFGQENIDRYFRSDEFLESHTLEVNFNLISYFKVLSDEDKSGVWFEILRDLPFIFDDNCILRNPSNGICFPTGLTTTEIGEIPTMNLEIYQKVEQSEPIYLWLKKLGIKQPSDVAYVTNVIIPNLAVEGYINDGNCFQITRYLQKLFLENLLDNEILEDLRELPLKVIGPPVGFSQAQDCFLSQRYRPRLSIQHLITSVNYVSDEYIVNNDELTWNRFFKAIKVKEDIEIEVINNNNQLPTLNNLTHEDWVKSARNQAERTGGFGFGMHNRIGNLKLPSFLKLTSVNFDYAVLFWKNLIDAGANLTALTENARFRYGIGYGTNSYAVSVDNYFSWFVEHIACIPTTTGELKLPGEVLLNNGDIKEIAGKYLPVFEFDRLVPIAWKQFFKMRDQLILDDYFTILSAMWENNGDTDQKEKVSALVVGRIYNSLAQLIEQMAPEDRHVFSDWATNNRLLAHDECFYSPKNLIWVNIPGFSGESSNFKSIRIASNVRIEMDGFKTLMELFGVKTIHEFLASYDEPEQDLSLITRIELILPVIITLVAEGKDKTIGQLFDKVYDKLNEIIFYSAKEIKLYFEYEQTRFDGPSLSVYRENNSLYFRGKWRKERTLMDLVGELATLIGAKGFESELRFLLMEEDRSEIEAWLKEKQIDRKEIPRVRVFRKQMITRKPHLDQYESESLTDQESSVYTDHELYHGYNGGDEAIEEIDDVLTAIDSPFQSDVGIDDISFVGRPFVFTSPVQRSDTSNAKIHYVKPEDEQYRVEVGNWSEAYVNRLLLESAEFDTIRWMNEFVESGKPYDFIVRYRGKDRYVEVKGTASLTKNLVYLSAPEWDTMFSSRADYFLFRVYGAGTDQHRYEAYQDPFEKIQTGAISVALEI